MSFALAVWPDGMKKEEAEKRPSSLEAESTIEEQRATKRRLQVHFDDKTPSGAPIKVKWRADENTHGIMALWVSNRQKCMATIDEDTIKESTAIYIMVTVASEFANGQLAVEEV